MTKQPQKKVVLYTRVSTEDQVDNYSLDFQEKVIRQYASANGMTVIQRFREEGCSGKYIENRPEYQSMMEFCMTQQVDAILIHRVDRLHRNLINAMTDRTRMMVRGIHIISVSEGVDSVDETTFMQFALLAALAEQTSHTISAETRKGLIAAAMNGLHNGGRPPYGFKVCPDTKLLEIDETTAPAVRQMFRLYADDYSMNQIIDWLKSNGYTTAKGKDFQINSIHAILHNEKYHGCFTYDKAMPKDSNGKRNSHKCKAEYLRIEGGCPAIVSEELFTKVQERLAENADRAQHHGTKRYYPLTGFLYCTCGRRMCGGVSYSKGNGYHKYNCLGKCGRESIRADHLEAFVLNAITECLFSSPNMKPLLASLNTVSKEHKHESDSMYQKLRSEQAGLQDKHENLMRALERGKITTIITNRIENIDEKMNQVTAKINSLTRDPHVFKAEDLQALQSKFETYLQSVNNVTNVSFLRSVLDRVEVGEDTVTIRLKNGIAIDKSTKIHLKGNDTMIISIPQETYKNYEAILLAIGSSDTPGYVTVKIGLSLDSAWSYGDILELDVPYESLFELASEADIDIYDLPGKHLRVEASVTDGTVIDIRGIAVMQA